MIQRLLAAVGVVVVVGCSAGSAGIEDKAWNDADVEFVQGMIPHHAQALDMVELTAGKSVSGDVALLAEDIRNAQGPEITLMQGFLAEWGTETDPHSGHGGSDTDADASHGMMTKDDLSALAVATGPAFEQMWITMMIAHHEGATTMAKQVLTAGKEPRVQALAQAVIASQTAEIAQMRALLASFG